MVEDPVLVAELDPTDAEAFTSMAVVQDQYHWERFRDEILSGAKVADEAFLQKIIQRYSCSFDVGKLPHPFAKPWVNFISGPDCKCDDQVKGNEHNSLKECRIFCLREFCHFVFIQSSHLPSRA
jgi:hypothetical protein